MRQMRVISFEEFVNVSFRFVLLRVGLELEFKTSEHCDHNHGYSNAQRCHLVVQLSGHKQDGFVH